MGYKTGVDKNQLTLVPFCADDYIDSNHICRVISAFTEQLDIVGLGFKYAECKDTGCPPYNPRMMLNLYIYGYLNRVRSSRRLQTETRRNVEVMWLMDGLRPDDRTICNFRKDNSKPLRGVFREFNRMCRALDLFGGEVAAVDGSKFRANNSRKNNHNPTTVERELNRLDKQINDYLTALDAADLHESTEQTPSSDKVKEALKKLNERKVKYEGFRERLKTESEISTVDPDARLMRQGGDSRELDVCYNVITAVDSKHHLIIDFDVTDGSDKGNLQNMAEKAKDTMGVETITLLGDKGFYDGQDITNCEESGVTCLVAKPKPGGAKMEEGFSCENFTYDKDRDCYVCPCANDLPFKRNQKHSNGKEYRVYANYSACNKCPQKKTCTKSRYRQIYRLPYQDTLDIVAKRLKDNKELYKKRQEIVEHPFGTMKTVWGYKCFLCRTKPKVTAETSLACLAYNLRRVINIFNGDIAKLMTHIAG